MKGKKPAKEIKSPGFTNTQVGAILEAVHKDVKAIAEGHSGLEKRLDNIEREVHGNSRRLDMVELSTRTTADRVGRLEDAVSMVSKDLKETRQELKDTKNELKNDIKETRSELKVKIEELGARLTSVESSRA